MDVVVSVKMVADSKIGLVSPYVATRHGLQKQTSNHHLLQSYRIPLYRSILKVAGSIALDQFKFAQCRIFSGFGDTNCNIQAIFKV
jgi:hypothetical protein